MMSTSWRRVEELLDASLQILDHMEVHNADADEWTQLTEQLKQQRQRLNGDIGNPPDWQELKQNVAGIKRQVTQLQRHLQQSYADSAPGGIDAYEAQALNDQLNNEQAYHDKIDDKSAIKLSENLSKLNETLEQMQN